jgi:tetratricopeptide (TPR) repeat protein
VATTDGAPPGWLRGRVAAVLATLVSVGLLYLVIRTAMASLSPVAASQLPPTESSQVLRLRLYELMLPGRRVAPDVLRLARQSALAEPLAFEPYFVQGRAAEEAGRLREAIVLMEEARRRRRSFAPTRLQLATYYTRAGRLAETLSELEVLLGLRPDATEPVMAELTKLISSADGRRVLAQTLARKPAWRTQFFAIARARAVRPDEALALLNEARRLEPRGDHRLERQLFVTSLINAGQIRRARQLWLEMLPPQERPLHQLMGNRGFAGTPVGEPFGWALHSADVGRAEIKDAGTRRPYLNVDYFGGSNLLLAEQLLALPAGAYKLRFDLAGESGSTSSRIYWGIACFSGSPLLLRYEMNRVTPNFRPQQVSFVVPEAGCDGQRLRLIAEAGDVPATSNLRIAGLEILR